MSIITITVNPATDKSVTADKVVPDDKIRCSEPVYEPGGGGINVSRAIKKLEGESTAWYMAGGETGDLMKRLLDEEQVTSRHIEIKGGLRENLIVLDENDKKQYRFGMPGARLEEKEWRALLEDIEKIDPVPDYIVASGSLSPGAPDDLYAQMASIASRRNIRFVLDTSGKALERTKGAGVYLMKPNLEELKYLAGVKEINPYELDKIARQIYDEYGCEILMVSLGARGVMLVTADKIDYMMSPVAEKKSAVGAGDSMVAGMVLALQRGWEVKRAVLYALASGTAAAITPGTELCRKEDTDLLFRWLESRESR